MDEKRMQREYGEAHSMRHIEWSDWSLAYTTGWRARDEAAPNRKLVEAAKSLFLELADIYDWDLRHNGVDGSYLNSHVDAIWKKFEALAEGEAALPSSASFAEPQAMPERWLPCEDDDPRSAGRCGVHGNYNGRLPRCPLCHPPQAAPTEGK